MPIIHGLFATANTPIPNSRTIHHPMRRLAAGEAAQAVAEGLERLVSLSEHEAEKGLRERAARAGLKIDPRFEVRYEIRECTDRGDALGSPAWSGIHAEARDAVGPSRTAQLQAERRARLAATPRPRRRDDDAPGL